MLCVFEKGLVCVQLPCRLPPHYLNGFSVFGWGFGLSEGGPLPSGVGGVSSKAAASIFDPLSSFSETFRPQHCGPFTAAQVVLDLSDLPTFSPPVPAKGQSPLSFGSLDLFRP